MIQFDSEINLGQILQLVVILIPGVWWAASMHQKVENIETKIMNMITREEVETMKEGADKEHEAIRDAAEAGDAAIRREMDVIRNRRR